MQQLTELDTNFLQQESVCTPMHICPVVIYDQSRRKGGKLKFRDIIQAFERNLHKSTIFRRKLSGGTFGLDTPYWVEDRDFDLEFHLRHIALPKPGDWRQFCIQLARLHSRGLDMSKPLWEAYVIEGLSNVEGLPEGSFAIMFKVHHAAVDGISGAEVVTAIHSLSDQLEVAVADDPWEGEAEPGPLYVWSRAYWHNLQRPLRLVSKARRLVPAFIKAREEEGADGGMKAPTLRTRFNGPVSPARVTDGVFLDLDNIKRMRKSVEGATVNDVVISIVGGGLRKYLDACGELPDTTLACGAPVSVRVERNSESTGNQVGQITIEMGTDIADPLERLRFVHQSAHKSKAFADALGGSLLMDVAEVMVPQVMGWGMRAGSLAAAKAEIPVPSHVIVSNVPGPQVPLYLCGARVHAMLGLGPVLHMVGMFHAVLSYVGTVSIQFVSCREMLPDPERYRQCLLDAYDELAAATLGGGRG